MVTKYKDSLIPFIGQVPQEWELLRNKNLFFLNKRLVGNRFSDYQLLSLTKNGVIEKDPENISGKQPESYDTYQEVKKNTIIMCLFDLDCSAVFSGISRHNGMISPAYKVLYGNDKTYMRYYDYLFWHIARERSYKNLSKNVRYTINDDEFGWIRSICPPIDEQKAIADFLDEECGKIDSIVADMETQIEILLQARKSLINSVTTQGISPSSDLVESNAEFFGMMPKHWEVKRVGTLFSFGKGLGITKEDLQDEGVPVVNYGEIHSKYGREVDPAIHPLRFVDEVFLRSNRNCLLNRGDFVFADTSEDVEGSGNFTFLNSSLTTFAGYHTIIVRPRVAMNSKYISYLFDSLKFRSQIQSRVSGVKVYSITKGILKSTKILFPPLDEQQAIADYLDAECGNIDAIIKDKQAAVDIMREYKKSLIYEYTTGKKRVKEALKDAN